MPKERRGRVALLLGHSEALLNTKHPPVQTAPQGTQPLEPLPGLQADGVHFSAAAEWTPPAQDLVAAMLSKAMKRL